MLMVSLLKIVRDRRVESLLFSTFKLDNYFGEFQRGSFGVMATRNIFMKNASRFMLGKEKLRKLKLKAIRRGVWFRVLSRVDRALVDLTMKVVDGVHSFRLAEALFSVVKKLEDALESRVSRALKEVGFPLARKLGLFAQKWGNKFARGWVCDKGFARFLAVMHINEPRVFTL